jgi:hypothetical protein
MTEAFEFGIRPPAHRGGAYAPAGRWNSEGGLLDFGLKRLSKETECIVNG